MTATHRSGLPLPDLLAKIGSTPTFHRRDLCSCSMEHALEFARAEASLGVSATYMVPHFEPLWKSPKLRDQLKELRGLGHSIGMHYAVLGDWLREGILPADTIGRALDVLRQDGPVVHAAAHGSELTYSIGAFEFEVFDHFDPLRNVGGRVHEWGAPLVSAKGLGLVECYIDGEHDRYVSDSLSTWRGWSGKPRPMPFEHIGGAMKAGLGALDGDGSLQFLSHPVYWRIEP